MTVIDFSVKVDGLENDTVPFGHLELEVKTVSSVVNYSRIK